MGGVMKRALSIIAAFISLCGFVSAKDFVIEVKAHYFSPSNPAFRDIYGGGIAYGAEVSIPVGKQLSVWFGGSRYSDRGELTFTKEETTIEILPLGCGLKYKMSRRGSGFYIGAGVNYCRFKEVNPIGDVSEGGLGLEAKIGNYVRIVDGLLIDIFVNYSYCKIKSADYRINVGGIEAGLGIGYGF
jgi:hypothetical protein